MKTISLTGPVLTQSGYGVHSRQIARWLLTKQDIDVKFIATPWGATPWMLNPDSHNGLVGEIMKRTVKPDSFKPDVSLQLQLPNEWKPSHGNFNVGITAAVETDKCHSHWVTACNNMDMIIVPSQHSKLSLTNAGTITKPLEVVPESFCDSIKNPTPSTLELKRPFNFLIFGQLTGNNPANDRKNIFYTVKWLCEEFKNDPDVGIVIKTNAGGNSKIDRNIVTNLFKQLLSEVRTGDTPVTILHGDMKDEEVASLYVHPKIKALVALTKGEGYGLPILEAAASGLPIIATGWSGHTDFLRHGKYVNVYYQLSEIPSSKVDDNIFVKGARWAQPSEEDFKKRVSKFKSSSLTPREWASDLQKKIQQLYSFEAICGYYDDKLEMHI